MTNLSKDFFIDNRKRLIKSVGQDGLIIIVGNARMQRSADTTYAFRQDSNLFYLTGINEPCATLIINTKTNQEWLMLPMRKGVTAIFDGQTNTQQLTAISGIVNIIDEPEGLKMLKQLHTMPWYSPAKPKHRLGDMYTNPYRAELLTKLTRFMHTKPNDIRVNLAKLRAIKNGDELALITKAIDITNQSLVAIRDTIDQYENEQTIEAEISKQFLLQGAQGHAYQPIIAGGIASCTLHYVDNNAPLHKGDMLLFDIGAECNNYAADISRTIVYKDNPTNRQSEVLHAVSEAQKEIIDWLAPGKTFKELAVKADEVVANKLVNLQLITPNYQKTDIREYFPHAVSHFLGLDVHDVGDYSLPLQLGMVITVEPGIYINKESIGVRIEDDVVITESGAKILGKSSPSLL